VVLKPRWFLNPGLYGTPWHRANDVVVNDADIEGPRDEATLKGTACLKKVLGIVVAVEVVGNHS